MCLALIDEWIAFAGFTTASQVCPNGLHVLFDDRSSRRMLRWKTDLSLLRSINLKRQDLTMVIYGALS